MSFNYYLLKFFRILLFPFSLIYGLIVTIRNFLFDKKLLRSASFNIPVIGIGNLSVGGTGKTPMVEYIIKLLKSTYQVATLSRGYKRKTKGYVLAHPGTTESEIGDEPMQFHLKFPEVTVAVGEERIVAMPRLLRDRPQTDIVILDDSFQHRWIKPGLNILLTDYSHLFTKDFFLPTGNLRDQKSSYKRADVIIVTKCRDGIVEEEADKIGKEINLLPHQQIFFTSIQYGQPYHIKNKEPCAVSSDDEVLLVTGIANPEPLKKYLAQKVRRYYHQSYSDHYTFTIDDLTEICAAFDDMDADKKIIITTEKDAVKLLKFNDQLMSVPLYVLPIEHRFLFGKGIQFDNVVNTFIKNYQESKN